MLLLMLSRLDIAECRLLNGLHRSYGGFVVKGFASFVLAIPYMWLYGVLHGCYEGAAYMFLVPVQFEGLRGLGSQISLQHVQVA